MLILLFIELVAVKERAGVERRWARRHIIDALVDTPISDVVVARRIEVVVVVIVSCKRT